MSREPRQVALPFEPPKTAGEEREVEILGVAALDRLCKTLLEGGTADVRVRGEISEARAATSGHVYFTLKDEREEAIIDAVMYRTAPVRDRKLLVEGERIVVRGRVTVFAPRGRMQLVADRVLASSRGDLLEALERLKRKLSEEGLFDPARKKRLPREPRLVAVVTSRDGAAIHDIVRVAFRRGRVGILLVPTPVQGAGAAARIAAAIRAADRVRGVEAIVVARGGGSAEDLAAFNDEDVVRAIARATRPIVSAVGHEIDVTLADLAADARAATPSQAAEMLVPDDAERRAALAHLRERLRRSLGHRLVAARAGLDKLRARLGEPRRRWHEAGQRVDELRLRLERGARRALAGRRGRLGEARRRLEARHPRAVLARARARLDALEPRLGAAVHKRLDAAALGVRGLAARSSAALGRALEARAHRLAALGARMEALSPLAVLARGYAIVTGPGGKALHAASEVAPGDALDVRLHRGRLAVRVERGEPPEGADRGRG
jgi:exodeoxyribonuclease VII large subunit